MVGETGGEWDAFVRYMARIKPLLALWVAALESPAPCHAPRFARLEAIQRHAHQLEAPEPLSVMHAALLASMDSALEAYIDLIIGRPSVRIAAIADASVQSLESFTQELVRIAITTTRLPAAQPARPLEQEYGAE